MKTILFFSILFMTSTSFSEDVVYQVKGKDYEGYYLKAKKDAPLIFLIHDWDGLTGYEKKRSQMLKKLGYSVFAMDLFGKGIRPQKLEDKREHTGELYKDRKKMRSLLEGAFQEAKKLGLNTKDAIVIGYCFGGAAVLEWARSGVNLKAFVTFHGGLGKPEGQDYKKTKGQVVIYHGTADSMIGMDLFAALANDLEVAKIPHQMITYGGAPHAFTVYDTPSYRKEADQRSWKHFTQFLKEAL
ncbi:MAG: dienelactone hydrolase family protein [Halobacteriovoraceae bacterium]|nr:dienelactone hydrolase family protein [Halobacteriovoraceae bacterium]MCB9095268.1 dienelactone hydrolase family protein [Halobacteriovoraceae bacterium]